VLLNKEADRTFSHLLLTLLQLSEIISLTSRRETVLSAIE